MTRLGLIGWPLTHSLSPVLHAAAGELAGLAVDYRLYPTPPDAVTETLARLQRDGLRGVNVTIPHKWAAAAWVDRLDPLAARLGAVNTVRFEADGTTVGFNTDVAGVRASLPTGPLDHAVLVGAGGAARAALAALAERCQAVWVLARRVAQAQALVNEVAPDVGRAGALADLIPWLTAADLVVDALPPHVGAVAQAPLGRLAPHGELLSLNYGASAQPALAAAAAAGRRGQDGLIMLAAQGVEAFTLWTGRRVPLDPVLARLRAASRGVDTPGHSVS